jgi:hypothetical protein
MSNYQPSHQNNIFTDIEYPLMNLNKPVSDNIHTSNQFILDTLKLLNSILLEFHYILFKMLELFVKIKIIKILKKPFTN